MSGYVCMPIVYVCLCMVVCMLRVYVLYVCMVGCMVRTYDMYVCRLRHVYYVFMYALYIYICMLCMHVGCAR